MMKHSLSRISTIITFMCCSMQSIDSWTTTTTTRINTLTISPKISFSLLSTHSNSNINSNSNISSKQSSTKLFSSSSSNNSNNINGGTPSYELMGLNEIQTLFREAVSSQDYDTASKLSNELANRISNGAYKYIYNGGVDKRKKKRLSWKGLGTAPWLEDRLDNLKYTFPTTIQINAFESVNSMLGLLDDDDDDEETLEELLYRKGQPGLNMGVVISGSTGEYFQLMISHLQLMISDHLSSITYFSNCIIIIIVINRKWKDVSIPSAIIVNIK